MGYRNFGQLTRKTKSIALAIICLILFVLCLILGITKNSGLVIISIGLLFQALSDIFVFVKCKNFDEKYAFKLDGPKDLSNEEKSNFKIYTSLISIFTILFIILLIIGIIICFV